MPPKLLTAQRKKAEEARKARNRESAANTYAARKEERLAARANPAGEQPQQPAAQSEDVQQLPATQPLQDDAAEMEGPPPQEMPDLCSGSEDEGPRVSTDGFSHLVLHGCTAGYLL